MHKFILAALFIGAVSTTGCSVESDSESELSESALKGGKFADGGACKCDKGDRGKGKSKSDAGKGKPDKDEADGGKGKPDKDEADGGKGKPEKDEADGGKGKSGEDHGKPDADENALEDEDALEDESVLPLKKYPDAGKGKPSDCTC
jgi:hypothetical protein